MKTILKPVVFILSALLFASPLLAQEVLTISVSGTGTTTPAAGVHLYPTGAVVPILANPGPGYEFSTWNGDVDLDAASSTVTMNVSKAIEAVFTLKVYSLPLTVSPAGASGAVFVPASPVPATHGQATGVSVTAPSGYRFDSWTTSTPGIVSIASSSSASTNVTVTGDSPALRADFIQQHQVSMRTNPTIVPGATLTPSGILWMDDNTSTAISATVPSGYRFDGWTSTGGTVSFDDASAASTNVTVTAGPTTLTANYVRVHQVSLQTSPGSIPGATLSPSTSFEADHNVATAISVVDPAGYRFDRWTSTGGTVSFDDASATSTNITVSGGPTIITANFIQEHDVIMQSSPSPIAGIVFSPGISFLADHNVTTAISVNEPAGYQFVNWTSTGGPVSIASNTSMSTNIRVSGPATLTANFNELLTLTLLSDTPGAVFDPLSPLTVVKDEYTAISVTPPEGYKFVSWEKTSGFSNITDENSASTTVQLFSSDATLTATFVKVFTLTMVSDPVGADFAPVSPAEAEINVPLAIAVANLDGYEFTEWEVTKGTATIANTTQQSTSVILYTEDAELTAHFLPTLTLTLETDVEGVIFTPLSPISVLQGELQSIFASTPDGYVFESWTVSLGNVDILTPTSSATSVSLPDGDATLKANYVLEEYALNLVTDGTTGAVFTPLSPVSVQHGVETAISVSVPEGYDFDHWETIFGTLTITDDTAAVTTVIMEEGGATLRAHFAKLIGVQNVEIGNNLMKIGDVITATITVENDGGTPYVLILGNIGGYALEGFQRLSNTIYMANFTITEGGNSYLPEENIPVSNLIISDGVDMSPAYTQEIIQDSDEVDASLPIIISMFVEPGDLKIGDVLTIEILADGVGYTALVAGTSVNMVSLIEDRLVFEEEGAGTYKLLYTIEEGDASVAAGGLSASIVLAKPSGNTALPYTSVSGVASLTIDALAPVISRMEVPNMEVGVGGIVLMTITADETGYLLAPGSVINGIPESSASIVFSELNGGLYALAYTVSEGDHEVAIGELEASIMLQDPAGNISEAFITIDPNTMEIYSEPPSVHFDGSPEICAGDEMELTIFLTGRPPFYLEISDGSTTEVFVDVNETKFTHTVMPLVNTTYSIPLLMDRNGVENAGTGNVIVQVNERTEVEITNLSSGYNVEADPFILEATPEGGTFSGPGVNSVTGEFDPARADTINSPHTLKYTYVNTAGCVSVDSALVFVLGADGDIFINATTVCDYADPFIVSASNIAGVIGSFGMYDDQGLVAPGLSDLGNNTASVDPSGLVSGTYTIEYAYLDGVVLYLRETFQVEALALPVFTEPTDTAFCQNNGPVNLRSDVAGAVFSGAGVSGSVEAGFVFDPAGLPVGSTIITCKVSSAFGCEKESELELNVLLAPQVDFRPKSACLPVDGGKVQFSNYTNGKAFVETWSWDFGDPTSGANNYSSDVEPEHYYRNAGDWTIRMEATTYQGCSSFLVLDTTLNSQPEPEFTWISDCFSEGVGNKFINLSNTGSSTADSIIWIFSDADGTELDRVVSDISEDTVEYNFPDADAYTASLYMRNKGGCNATASEEIQLRPTIKLRDLVYDVDFNLSEDRWISGSEDELNSWSWGTPDFEGFTPGAGDQAWYTDLAPGSPGYMEQSWVQGPCFDFTGLKRPLIQLDLMRSFIPNSNGAVIQYMDSRQEGWFPVGDSISGLNWYNSTDIQNTPGGSETGWTLEVFNPDTDWISAAHDMDELQGKKQVALRIALASSGSQAIGNQGFAFDNVRISEKTKLSVLEYFTNSSDPTCKTADVVVDAYFAEHGADVIDLQYHAAYPGSDPMNTNNPKPASNRAGNLLIGQVPYAVLDGGVGDLYRYDFSSGDNVPGAEELKMKALESPLFNIDLEVNWAEGQMSLITDVKCVTDQYSEYVQLYIVVFEKLVTAYTGGNGDEEFRNVVLKMLPNTAGKLLGNNWSKGDVKTFLADWDWSEESYVEDVEDLAVAVFVQDRTSRQVLQAAVDYSTPLTSAPGNPAAMEELSVYPNPVRDRLYVNLGTPSGEKGMLYVHDLNGRRIMEMQIESGQQILGLDVQSLPAGVYLISRTEAGVVSQHSKFVKTR